MANRSWFYASNGQQQGPYPDAQLRELIARGTVTADNAGLEAREWRAGKRAAENSRACFSSASSGALGQPAVPRSAFRWPAPAANGGGALSIDLGLWEFLGPQPGVFDRISVGDPRRPGWQPTSTSG